MTMSAPFNIRIMNVSAAIDRLQAKQVTSHNMFEATSTRFHPNGLYSEEIFGEIGTQQRSEYYGYIDLKTKILHPHVFKMLLSLRNAYDGIVTGRTYAKFVDGEDADFLLCDKHTPGALTGYSFFMSNIMKVVFKRTGYVKRDKKLAILNKYSEDELFIDKFLVSPAGIRDVQVDKNGRTSSEEINKLYLGLLSLSQALPDNMDEELTLLYDPVRYSIQKKTLEIWEYLWNIFSGNRGFAQNKHASRAISWGARNVISAPKIETVTPDDPDYLKHDQTLFPLYQTMKMFQPIVIQRARTIFVEPFFTSGSQEIPLIDPKTYKLKYVELSEKEFAKWNSKLGIENLINEFEEETVREFPVTMTGLDNKNYYLWLAYDTGDEVYFLRNIEEFSDHYRRLNPDKEIDMTNIRPMAVVELFYIAAMDGLPDKHAVITRYPAVEAGSTYPSKVEIGTTVPSRVVRFIKHTSEINPDGSSPHMVLPRYPIFKRPYLDSSVPHASKLGGLGGDYDGDMISTNSTMSNESNMEIQKFLRSAASIVHIDKKFQSPLSNNLMDLIFFNLSRDPSETR